jgi:DNA-binding transcriptional regulator YiaG
MDNKEKKQLSESDIKAKFSTPAIISKAKALCGQLGSAQENSANQLRVKFATVNRWKNGKANPSKLAKNQFELFCLEQKKQGML